MFKRLIASIILVTFVVTTVLPPQIASAQTIGGILLPNPGTMMAPSPAFVPVLIKGLKLHPENPLQFDFIIDNGHTKFNQNQVKDESQKLIKYFFAALTVPANDFWVNLSPHESQRIIPTELSKTELGRDLLAQDYILKQLTASFLSPESEVGKKFWDKIYKQAQEKFGTTELPIKTFNKVWITPESATIYENGQTAYIVKSRLKVMLDGDYTATQESQGVSHPGGVSDTPGVDELSSQIMREIVLPAIEKEVNEGKHFAPLRQIYHSLLLAKWYKQIIKDTAFSKAYVDQNKVTGIDMADTTVTNQIYNLYVDAYKKGAYTFIKEDYDALSEESIPRKYFTGGVRDNINMAMLSVKNNELDRSKLLTGQGFEVSVDSIVNNKTMQAAAPNRAMMNAAVSGLFEHQINLKTRIYHAVNGESYIVSLAELWEARREIRNSRHPRYRLDHEVGIQGLNWDGTIQEILDALASPEAFGMSLRHPGPDGEGYYCNLRTLWDERAKIRSGIYYIKPEHRVEQGEWNSTVAEILSDLENGNFSVPNRAMLGEYLPLVFSPDTADFLSNLLSNLLSMETGIVAIAFLGSPPGILARHWMWTRYTVRGSFQILEFPASPVEDRIRAVEFLSKRGRTKLLLSRLEVEFNPDVVAAIVNFLQQSRVPREEIQKAVLNNLSFNKLTGAHTEIAKIAKELGASDQDLRMAYTEAAKNPGGDPVSKGQAQAALQLLGRSTSSSGTSNAAMMGGVIHQFETMQLPSYRYGSASIEAGQRAIVRAILAQTLVSTGKSQEEVLNAYTNISLPSFLFGPEFSEGERYIIQAIVAQTVLMTGKSPEDVLTAFEKESLPPYFYDLAISQGQRAIIQAIFSQTALITGKSSQDVLTGFERLALPAYFNSEKLGKGGRFIIRALFSQTVLSMGISPTAIFSAYERTTFPSYLYGSQFSVGERFIIKSLLSKPFNLAMMADAQTGRELASILRPFFNRTTWRDKPDAGRIAAAKRDLSPRDYAVFEAVNKNFSYSVEQFDRDGFGATDISRWTSANLIDWLNKKRSESSPGRKSRNHAMMADLQAEIGPILTSIERSEGQADLRDLRPWTDDVKKTLGRAIEALAQPKADVANISYRLRISLGVLTDHRINAALVALQQKEQSPAVRQAQNNLNTTLRGLRATLRNRAMLATASIRPTMNERVKINLRVMWSGLSGIVGGMPVDKRENLHNILYRISPHMLHDPEWFKLTLELILFHEIMDWDDNSPAAEARKIVLIGALQKYIPKNQHVIFERLKASIISDQGASLVDTVNAFQNQALQKDLRRIVQRKAFRGIVPWALHTLQMTAYAEAAKSWGESESYERELTTFVEAVRGLVPQDQQNKVQYKRIFDKPVKKQRPKPVQEPSKNSDPDILAAARRFFDDFQGRVLKIDDEVGAALRSVVVRKGYGVFSLNAEPAPKNMMLTWNGNGARDSRKENLEISKDAFEQLVTAMLADPSKQRSAIALVARSTLSEVPAVVQEVDAGPPSAPEVSRVILEDGDAAKIVQYLSQQNEPVSIQKLIMDVFKVDPASAAGRSKKRSIAALAQVGIIGSSRNPEREKQPTDGLYLKDDDKKHLDAIVQLLNDFLSSPTITRLDAEIAKKNIDRLKAGVELAVILREARKSGKKGVVSIPTMIFNYFLESAGRDPARAVTRQEIYQYIRSQAGTSRDPFPFVYIALYLDQLASAGLIQGQNFRKFEEGRGHLRTPFFEDNVPMQFVINPDIILQGNDTAPQRADSIRKLFDQIEHPESGNTQKRMQAIIAQFTGLKVGIQEASGSSSPAMMADEDSLVRAKLTLAASTQELIALIRPARALPNEFITEAGTVDLHYRKIYLKVVGAILALVEAINSAIGASQLSISEDRLRSLLPVILFIFENPEWSFNRLNVEDIERAGGENAGALYNKLQEIQSQLQGILPSSRAMMVQVDEFLSLLRSGEVTGKSGEIGVEEIKLEGLPSGVFINKEGVQKNRQAIAQAALSLAVAVNEHFEKLRAKAPANGAKASMDAHKRDTFSLGELSFVHMTGLEKYNLERRDLIFLMAFGKFLGFWQIEKMRDGNLGIVDPDMKKIQEAANRAMLIGYATVEDLEDIVMHTVRTELNFPMEDTPELTPKTKISRLPGDDMLYLQIFDALRRIYPDFEDPAIIKDKLAIPHIVDSVKKSLKFPFPVKGLKEELFPQNALQLKHRLLSLQRRLARAEKEKEKAALQIQIDTVRRILGPNALKPTGLQAVMDDFMQRLDKLAGRDSDTFLISKAGIRSVLHIFEEPKVFTVAQIIEALKTMKGIKEDLLQESYNYGVSAPLVIEITNSLEQLMIRSKEQLGEIYNKFDSILEKISLSEEGTDPRIVAEHTHWRRQIERVLVNINRLSRGRKDVGVLQIKKNLDDLEKIKKNLKGKQFNTKSLKTVIRKMSARLNNLSIADPVVNTVRRAAGNAAMMVQVDEFLSLLRSGEVMGNPGEDGVEEIKLGGLPSGVFINKKGVQKNRQVIAQAALSLAEVVDQQFVQTHRAAVAKGKTAFSSGLIPFASMANLLGYRLDESDITALMAFGKFLDFWQIETMPDGNLGIGDPSMKKISQAAVGEDVPDDEAGVEIITEGSTVLLGPMEGGKSPTIHNIGRITQAFVEEALNKAIASNEGGDKRVSPLPPRRGKALRVAVMYGDKPEDLEAAHRVMEVLAHSQSATQIIPFLANRSIALDQATRLMDTKVYGDLAPDYMLYLGALSGKTAFQGMHILGRKTQDLLFDKKGKFVEPVKVAPAEVDPAKVDPAKKDPPKAKPVATHSLLDLISRRATADDPFYKKVPFGQIKLHKLNLDVYLNVKLGKKKPTSLARNRFVAAIVGERKDLMLNPKESIAHGVGTLVDVLAEVEAAYPGYRMDQVSAFQEQRGLFRFGGFTAKVFTTEPSEITPAFMETSRNGDQITVDFYGINAAGKNVLEGTVTLIPRKAGERREEADSLEEKLQRVYGEANNIQPEQPRPTAWHFEKKIITLPSWPDPQAGPEVTSERRVTEKLLEWEALWHGAKKPSKELLVLGIFSYASDQVSRGDWVLNGLGDVKFTDVSLEPGDTVELTGEVEQYEDQGISSTTGKPSFKKRVRYKLTKVSPSGNREALAAGVTEMTVKESRPQLNMYYQAFPEVEEWVNEAEQYLQETKVENPDVVKVDITEGVATVTLSRPEKSNAMDNNMRLALYQRIGELETNPDVRAIIITGEGKAFVAGADVQAIFDSRNDKPWLGRLIRQMLFRRIGKCSKSKPVIAALNGITSDEGLELALAASYRVGSDTGDEEVIGQPEITLGILAATRGLTQLVGRRTAALILLSGAKLTMQKAHDIVLVDELVPDALQRAKELAKAIAGDQKLPARRNIERFRIMLAFKAQPFGEEPAIKELVERSKSLGRGKAAEAIVRAIEFNTTHDPLVSDLNEARLAAIVEKTDEAGNGLKRFIETGESGPSLPMPAVLLPTTNAAMMTGAEVFKSALLEHLVQAGIKPQALEQYIDSLTSTGPIDSEEQRIVAAVVRSSIAEVGYQSDLPFSVALMREVQAQLILQEAEAEAKRPAEPKDLIALLYSGKVLGNNPREDGVESVRLKIASGSVGFIIKKQGAQDNIQTIARAALRLQEVVNRVYANARFSGQEAFSSGNFSVVSMAKLSGYYLKQDNLLPLMALGQSLGFWKIATMKDGYAGIVDPDMEKIRNAATASAAMMGNVDQYFSLTQQGNDKDPRPRDARLQAATALIDAVPENNLQAFAIEIRSDRRAGLMSDIDDAVEQHLGKGLKQIETLSQPISVLDFSDRQYYSSPQSTQLLLSLFKREKIETLGDLIARSESELRSLEGFGNMMVRRIKLALDKVNLALYRNPDATTEQRALSVKARIRFLTKKQKDLSTQEISSERLSATLTELSAIADELKILRVLSVNPKPSGGEILTWSVDFLELSARARRVLSSLKILTIQQLTETSEEYLLTAEDMGVTTVTEIKTKLGAFGLSLSSQISPAEAASMRFFVSSEPEPDIERYFTLTHQGANNDPGSRDERLQAAKDLIDRMRKSHLRWFALAIKIDKRSGVQSDIGTEAQAYIRRILDAKRGDAAMLTEADFDRITRILAGKDQERIDGISPEDLGHAQAYVTRKIGNREREFGRDPRDPAQGSPLVVDDDPQGVWNWLILQRRTISREITRRKFLNDKARRQIEEWLSGPHKQDFLEIIPTYRVEEAKPVAIQLLQELRGKPLKYTIFGTKTTKGALVARLASGNDNEIHFATMRQSQRQRFAQIVLGRMTAAPAGNAAMLVNVTALYDFLRQRLPGSSPSEEGRLSTWFAGGDLPSFIKDVEDRLGIHIRNLNDQPYLETVGELITYLRRYGLHSSQLGTSDEVIHLISLYYEKRDLSKGNKDVLRDYVVQQWSQIVADAPGETALAQSRRADYLPRLEFDSAIKDDNDKNEALYMAESYVRVLGSKSGSGNRAMMGEDITVTLTAMDALRTELPRLVTQGAVVSTEIFIRQRLGHLEGLLRQVRYASTRPLEVDLPGLVKELRLLEELKKATNDTFIQFRSENDAISNFRAALVKLRLSVHQLTLFAQAKTFLDKSVGKEITIQISTLHAIQTALGSLNQHGIYEERNDPKFDESNLPGRVVFSAVSWPNRPDRKEKKVLILKKGKFMTFVADLYSRDPETAQLLLAEVMPSGDRAMMADQLGGIDMNEMDYDKTGAGVSIEFNEENLKAIMPNGIDTLTPVIIRVVPVINILPLLGLQEKPQSELEISKN